MADTSTHQSAGSLPEVKRPLARVVARRLAVLIAVVTLVMCTAGYFYSMGSTEELVRQQLLKFINERGLRESSLFLESGAYQARFQTEYVERYKRMGDEDPQDWFDEHMEKNPADGTYRSKRELYDGKDVKLGRRHAGISVVIGADAKLTPEAIKALAIGCDMVSQYGPAWRKPFLNLYFASPEKMAMDYWPGTSWGLDAVDKVDWRKEEWYAISTIEKNPERKQRWSGVLYDLQDKNWMVSNVTPLDIDGKQVGLVGCDLPLDELIERTSNETLADTYNIIMQADGRIIVHPGMVDEIIASKGLLTAQKASDKHMLSIYEAALEAKAFPVVIDHRDEFLAITRIQGPDWYFITVYPKSLLRGQAIEDAGFILASGLGALVVTIFVIVFVLNRDLVTPLERLTHTIRDFDIGSGQWSDRTDAFIKKAAEISTRPDETGLLGRSFVEMGERLRGAYCELEESENRFRALFEQAGDYILLLELSAENSLVIIDANQAAIEKHGFTRDEFIGKSIDSLDRSMDAKRTQDILDVLMSGKAIVLETTHTKKDGTVFPVEVSAKILDVGEGPTRIISIERDITKRKHAEAEKERIEGQLQQAQKMEAVGQLAGGIAHDFNNLLTSIQGNAELLKLDMPADGEAAILAGEIIKGSNRAADLTRQLLAFARKGKRQMEPIDIHSIVTQTAHMLAHTIDRRIEVRLELHASPSVVMGDPAQLHSAMLNLGVNARDAMTKGGTLTYTTRNVTLTRGDCPNHSQKLTPGDFLEIGITDTGVGMDEQTRERIFEPFFTTKDVGKGTGLGLAGVYGCVRSHDGGIDVASEPGRGATFTILLPLADAIAVAGDQTVPGNEPIRGTGHILLVDDEESVRKFVQASLQNLGYTVSTCNDGSAAVDYYRENHQEIDLVILDLVMPKMNGQDALANMKKINAGVRVIVASGFSHSDAITQIMDEGALALLNKPFQITELAQAVARHISRDSE